MLWCLHGFFGSAHDFDGFDFGVEKECLDFFYADVPTRNDFPFKECRESLKRFAKEFNHYVRTRDKNPSLLGYSLGGRLALHALLDDPELWKKTVIISAHPGLCTEAEKQERAAADLHLAKRFLCENLAALRSEWEKNALFGGFRITREEIQFSRNTLSQALISWSLAEQQDLLPQLSDLQNDVLWVVGERDEKFLELGEKACQVMPGSRFCVIPQASHRAPWQQQQFFEECVRNFLCHHEEAELTW